MRPFVTIKALIGCGLIAIALSGHPADAAGFCEKLILGNAQLNMDLKVSENGTAKVNVFEGEMPLLGRMINVIASNLLGRALKLSEIQPVLTRFYADTSADPFFLKLANAFQLSIERNSELDLQMREHLGLNQEGPRPAVIFAAKHTSNGTETMALAALVSKYRADVKIVLTSALKILPGIEHNAILIDISGTPEAKKINQTRRQEMQDFVASGGVMILHPSGAVASEVDPLGGLSIEPPWKSGIFELMEKNPKAKVVLVNFNHQPSSGFLRRGAYPVIGTLLRPILHIREITNNIGTNFETAMSDGFSAEELTRKFGGSRRKVLDFMQALTNLLVTKFGDSPAKNGYSLASLALIAIHSAKMGLPSHQPSIPKYIEADLNTVASGIETEEDLNRIVMAIDGKPARQ